MDTLDVGIGRGQVNRQVGQVERSRVRQRQCHPAGLTRIAERVAIAEGWVEAADRHRLNNDAWQIHFGAIDDETERRHVVGDAVVVTVHHQRRVTLVAEAVPIGVGLTGGPRDDRRVGRHRAVVDRIRHAIDVDVVIV